MRISEKAIEFPRLVIVACAALVLFGFMGMQQLPKERTPRVRLPIVVVAAANPGAAPQTNDVQIVRRIEDEAAGALRDLDVDGGIQSSALYGAGIVQFFFEDGVDVRSAKQDVQELINRIKGEFPQRAQTDPGPIVDEVDFEGWPVVQVFVAGGDEARRTSLGDDLKERLETLPGVRLVQEFGRREREAHVLVDPQRLAEQGLSVAALEDALRRGNIDLPTGELERGALERRVRFEGRFRDLEEMRGLPVATRGGSIIRLGDVAQVEMGYEPATSLARYGGMEAVVLQVLGKREINVLALAERAEAEVAHFARQRGMSGQASVAGEDQIIIGSNRSQGREIRIMFDQLGSSAVYGLVLVVIVLAVFMGLRNSLLISIAIPFSLVTAAAFALAAKRTFYEDFAVNNMTMFSLILVIGMVVDGALIVGENIYRHREMGQSPVEAARLGIREVGPAVIAADLTTIAAFAPMYVVRGVMGDFMGVMPTVVIFALTASLIVDHFLLPVLSVYLMKVPERKLERARALGAIAKHGSLDPDALERAAAANPFLRVYRSMLEYAMRHRALVLALSVLAAATPVGLIGVGAIGFEFFPRNDYGVIEAYVEAPAGTDMETGTVAAVAQVEQAIDRAVRPEEWRRPREGGAPARPTSTLGETGALSTRLEAASDSGPEFARIYCELVLPEARERSVDEIIEAIRAELPDMPGVRVRLEAPSEGPPAGAEIYLRVLADDNVPLERLAERAAEIEEILRSVNGVYDVTSTHRLRPQYRASPIREVAGFFGVPAVNIATALNAALRGVEVSDVDFGADEEIDIRVRSADESRRSLEDLRDLPIAAPDGRVVGLDQLADIERVLEPGGILRYDRRRMIAISASLRDPLLPDDVKRTVSARLAERAGEDAPSPSGGASRTEIFRDREIAVQLGGENQIRDEAVQDLELAMLIAVALMALILILQFNSFVQALLVLSTVPLSLIGVGFGLAITGYNFSVAAMIGVVALAGIVVNDAIVLVDFTNQLRREGVALPRAVALAGQVRMRPVLLTTVTTIGGLMPLALNIAGGAEFWRPLTISMIFGYASATLLTLFIVPLGYLTFVREGGHWLNPAEHPALSRPAIPGA